MTSSIDKRHGRIDIYLRDATYRRFETRVRASAGQRVGSGAVLVARNTGRMCLALRSGKVEHPHTWATWGGYVQDGSPQISCIKEIREETGYRKAIELIPLFLYEDPTCRYYNFLALVQHQFDPVLNGENEKSLWTDLDHLPRPLHFGLVALLRDAKAVSMLRRYVKS